MTSPIHLPSTDSMNSLESPLWGATFFITDLQGTKDLMVAERRALTLVKQLPCARSIVTFRVPISVRKFLYLPVYGFGQLRSEIYSNLTDVPPLASGISKIWARVSNARIHAHCTTLSCLLESAGSVSLKHSFAICLTWETFPSSVFFIWKSE